MHEISNSKGCKMNNIQRKSGSFRSIARKLGQIMLIAISVISAVVIILAGVLLFFSPGKQIPFTNGNGATIEGSISEKAYVNINGVKQAMFIKSKDATHPVLLFLHGGMPEYFLTRRYPTGLEDHFTVVWWEQRGSGIAYNPNIPKETLTLEQMVSDTIEVTNYLRDRFQQDKIYLMAHSGGSFIGIHAAAQAPELYHAYIGVAQMSDQLQSEILAYEYMLQKYQENGNTKMVEKLEGAPVTLTGGIPYEYLVLRDPGMHPLGIGTTHDMKSVFTGIFLPSLAHPEFTLPEKFNHWRAKSQSGVSSLWDRMITTDLADEVPELTIPVYFLHGIYDYTCSYSLAKAYFEQLKAPIKGFYTFEQSAHSPIMEEPEKTQKILLEDVLTGTNHLADIK